MCCVLCVLSRYSMPSRMHAIVGRLLCECVIDSFAACRLVYSFLLDCTSVYVACRRALKQLCPTRERAQRNALIVNRHRCYRRRHAQHAKNASAFLRHQHTSHAHSHTQSANTQSQLTTRYGKLEIQFIYGSRVSHETRDETGEIINIK